MASVTLKEFDRWWAGYRDWLQRKIEAEHIHPDDAKDIVQDIYLVMKQRILTLGPIEHPAGYLRVVLIRRIRDFKQRQRKTQSITEEEAQTGSGVAPSAEETVLRRDEIERLRTVWREAKPVRQLCILFSLECDQANQLVAPTALVDYVAQLLEVCLEVSLEVATDKAYTVVDGLPLSGMAIAEILGISMSNVAMLRHRTREFLWKELER